MAMVELTADDSTIAFVVAHEMTHNFAHDPARKNPFGSLLLQFGLGAARVKKSEISADTVAVTLMANAGYDLAAPERLLRKSGSSHWMDLTITHRHRAAYNHSAARRSACRSALCQWQIIAQYRRAAPSICHDDSLEMQCARKQLMPPEGRHSGPQIQAHHGLAGQLPLFWPPLPLPVPELLPLPQFFELLAMAIVAALADASTAASERGENPFDLLTAGSAQASGTHAFLFLTCSSVFLHFTTTRSVVCVARDGFGALAAAGGIAI